MNITFDAWRALPTLTIREINAGACNRGHALLPDGYRNRKGYVRCLGCAGQAPGKPMCRNGRHPRPASGRCPSCAQEKRERAYAAVRAAKAAEAADKADAGGEKLRDVSYMFVGLPPAEVLDNAKCGPETAALFDSLEKRTSEAAVGKLPARVLAAMDICAGCPVRALCREDAIRWRREGVYGGVYFTRRWHANAAAARHEGRPVPPLRTLEAAREDAERLDDAS